MTKITYAVSGLREMRLEFQRLAGVPTKAITGLENALTQAFGATQAATHIITGSLKASGKTESDFDGEQWTGSIAYGGESAGPNNPVRYAIYERARGGAHDFMEPITAYEPYFEKAMNDWFDPK